MYKTKSASEKGRESTANYYFRRKKIDDDMQLKKHIPNTITSMNLLCGTLSTVSALSGSLKLAALLLFMGAVFDFFDGFVARLLGVSSAIGKELDSLADLVSFGFAPAAMFSTYIKFVFTGSYTINIFANSFLTIWCLLPFIMVVFAGIRLAKFNIDERQTENFLGLTTTATGLFTASLVWMTSSMPELFVGWLRPSVVMFIVMIFCVLLVSEVPMFSLKIKHWTWQGNELRFILLGIGAVSIGVLGLGGISLTILLYIIFSVVRFALSD